MDDDLNPYKVLGVKRDADEATIRRAYRDVSKRTHPDAGGTDEAFAKVSTSLAVLTDPKRRDTYDRTGRIDDGPGPDNDRAAAIGIVEGHLAGIINAFFSQAMDPALDPRRIDVVGKIVDVIEIEIEQAKIGLQGGAMVLEGLRDIGRRFTPLTAPAEGEEDPIARSFKRQIEGHEQELARLRKSVEVHRLAIEIARGYKFEHDKPARRPLHGTHFDGWPTRAERPSDRYR